MCVCVCVCVCECIMRPVKPELGVIPSGKKYSTVNISW